MTPATLPRTGPARRVGPVPAIFVVLALAAVAIAALLAITAIRSTFDPTFETVTHAQARNGAQTADVRVQFGAGNLSVGALDAADDSLARMSFEGPTSVRPEASYDVRGPVGELAYLSRDADQVWQNVPFIGRAGDHARFRLQLARGVPLDLDIQGGAADAQLELTALQVRRLDLQTGAADTRLRLPAAAGATSVEVRAGLGQLDITVPEGVAADIEMTTGLGDRAIDTRRFVPLGNGHYRSADWSTAANRVQMQLGLGAGDLSVR